MEAETLTKVEETVLSILRTADMNEMTEFKVRSLAGQKLGLDLSTPQLKKFVRSTVESFLTSQQEEQAQEEEVEEEKAQEEEKTQEEEVEAKEAKEKKRKEKEVEEEQEEEEEEEEEKKSRGGGRKDYDDNGDLIMCRLSSKRRVTIQEFKGKTLISIREYYQKDGKELPSSKGISLTAEQWSTFRKAVPAIEESIKKIESSPRIGRRRSGIPVLKRTGFAVGKLSGLPFSCTDIDIFKFFSGLHVVDVLLVNKNGMPTGEAFVVFASPLQLELAVQRGRVFTRVAVFTSNKQDYYDAVASEVKSERAYYDEFCYIPSPERRPKKSDQLGFTNVIKMQGLPYSATTSDIAEAFGESELTADGVLIVCGPDKKATGEAYVEFESVDDARKAFLCKDRVTIGSHCVELFPSTPDEVECAKSRSGH